MPCASTGSIPPPDISQRLHTLYAVGGILASAQIEGNSLSEEQARARVAGDLHLPESQEYLGQEIDKMREACDLVAAEVYEGAELPLTLDRIKKFNEKVIKSLPLEEGVIPGEIRTKGVVVGSVYVGPPAADCEYLLEELCD